MKDQDKFRKIPESMLSKMADQVEEIEAAIREDILVEGPINVAGIHANCLAIRRTVRNKIEFWISFTINGQEIQINQDVDMVSFYQLPETNHGRSLQEFAMSEIVSCVLITAATLIVKEMAQNVVFLPDDFRL